MSDRPQTAGPPTGARRVGFLGPLDFRGSLLGGLPFTFPATTDNFLSTGGHLASSCREERGGKKTHRLGVFPRQSSVIETFI
jgi:hypothetical protein